MLTDRSFSYKNLIYIEDVEHLLNKAITYDLYLFFKL